MKALGSVPVCQREAGGGRGWGGGWSKKMKVAKRGRSMKMWERNAKGLVRLRQLS